MWVRGGRGCDLQDIQTSDGCYGVVEEVLYLIEQGLLLETVIGILDT